MSNQHNKNVILLPKVEHRIAWRNLLRELEGLHGHGPDKTSSVNIPCFKKRYYYTIKQIQYTENSKECRTECKKNSIEQFNKDEKAVSRDFCFEQELELAIAISKEEQEIATDLEMFRIQMNAIEMGENDIQCENKEYPQHQQGFENVTFVCSRMEKVEIVQDKSESVHNEMANKQENDRRVIVDVSGVKFFTCLSILRKEPESVFCKEPGSSAEYIFYRKPEIFSIILDYLMGYEIDWSMDKCTFNMLLQDCDFYNLKNLKLKVMDRELDELVADCDKNNSVKDWFSEMRELIIQFWLFEQNGIPVLKNFTLPDESARPLKIYQQLLEMRKLYFNIHSLQVIKDNMKAAWSVLVITSTMAFLLSNKDKKFFNALELIAKEKERILQECFEKIKDKAERKNEAYDEKNHQDVFIFDIMDALKILFIPFLMELMPPILMIHNFAENQNK